MAHIDNRIKNARKVRRHKEKVLKSQIADLKKQVQGQQLILELLFQFCRSVAYKERRDLLSYQQLYSPSTDSSKKVRMLFQQIREFCQMSSD